MHRRRFKILIRRPGQTEHRSAWFDARHQSCTRWTLDTWSHGSPIMGAWKYMTFPDVLSRLAERGCEVLVAGSEMVEDRKQHLETTPGNGSLKSQTL